MKAVPLQPSEVGAFFNGDSYLVLDNRGEDGADLHMWIGERLETHLAHAARRRTLPDSSPTLCTFDFTWRKMMGEYPISILLHPVIELSIVWCLLHTLPWEKG